MVKKSGGQIFGAHLTAAEKKAMNMEIQKQTAEYDRRNAIEIEAIVLWILTQNWDFTPSEVEQFHKEFEPSIRSLCERYEMTEMGDDSWLCTHKLKDQGIDISKWYDKEVN